MIKVEGIDGSGRCRSWNGDCLGWQSDQAGRCKCTLSSTKRRLRAEGVAFGSVFKFDLDGLESLTPRASLGEQRDC